MPAVDRAILRLGHLRAAAGATTSRTRSSIDQAVELARSLSTDDSPAFVNGLLGRLLELKPSLAPPPPQT